MNDTLRCLAVFSTVACVIAVSIWGPETLAKYKDRGILNQPHIEAVEQAGEGYRYQMNANEKLYILSRCLGTQMVSENDPANTDLAYEDLEGSYAFVRKYNGPSGKEITDEQIYTTCNEGLEMLKALGILPDEVREVNAASYDATLYSAIDVLEPRNNVVVWKMELSNSQRNANKANRLIDACIDADDGRIYEFYARTSLAWGEIDTDAIVEAWRTYMGLSAPSAYESDNPLLEATPYFKKYVFSGMGEGRTIVTVGYYEGINELFLKIS